MDWDAVPRVLLLGPFRHIPPSCRCKDTTRNRYFQIFGCFYLQNLEKVHFSPPVASPTEGDGCVCRRHTSDCCEAASKVGEKGRIDSGAFLFFRKKMLRRRQASRLARALIAAQQPFSFSFLLFSFYFSFCATFPFLFLFVFFSFVFVTCIANDANALNALQNVADDANEKTTIKKVKI